MIFRQQEKSMLKVAHVCNYAPNLSGMYGTVKDLLVQERKMGLNAEIIDDAGANFLYGKDEITPVGSKYGDGADIVCWHHAMFEDWFNEPHRNIVLFLHGTPEFNLQTELYSSDRPLSLIVGLSNKQIPRAIVTMWKRHVPFWESMLKMKVHYVPAWTDVGAWELSQHSVDKKEIKIAMMDYWRLTREPMGLFAGIDYLKKNTDKKIKVDVWGLTEIPNNTWMATIQWLIDDGTVVLKGNSDNPARDIYSQYDMILTMSNEETRVIRESFSCGVPVVCGRKVCFDKYSVDSSDAIMVAKKINQCHEDILKDTDIVRKKIRQYAENNFSVEKSAKKVVKIFKDIVKEHGSVNRPKCPLNNGVRMVHSIDTTCDSISKNFCGKDRKFFLRFGDGDFLIMSNQGRDSFHEFSVELRDELIESFSIEDKSYMISSSIGMVNEGRMRKGLFATFDYDDRLRDISKSLKPGQTLYNAIALAYKSVFDPVWFIDFLNGCVRNKRVLFIGGKSVCGNSLINSVFNVNYEISFPDSDAYNELAEKYDSIKEQCDNFDIVVCAIGMGTRVLAKRLWKDNVNVQFLDIGSIVDALCEIKTRTWIKLISDDYIKNFKRSFPQKDKTVSVIIPTYENEDVTIECINTVRQKTDSNYEIIWIDNGSSDSSYNKVKKKFENDDIIKPIRRGDNGGFSKAVNIGIKKVLYENKSDYILLLNNDVLVSDFWIDRLICSLEVSGLDAVGPLTSKNNPHSLNNIRNIVPDLPVFDNEDTDSISQKLWDKYGSQCIQSENMISFFCCLLRKKAFEKIGLLDEEMFCYGEDNDFFKRASMYGLKFGISLGTYVYHAHMLTSKLFGDEWISNMKQKSVEYLKDKYKVVAKRI